LNIESSYRRAVTATNRLHCRMFLADAALRSLRWMDSPVVDLIFRAVGHGFAS